MNPEHSKGLVVAAIISAAAVIIAAIIALLAPFAQNWAAQNSPVSAPNVDSVSSPQIIVVTATSPPQLFNQPTSEINSQATLPQPAGICQEAGGASGFPLPPIPSAPTNGCVLIVEWWVPPDAGNCGILITIDEPILAEGSIGAWWYVYPQRPNSHKQEFLAKNPHCIVEDLR